MKRVLCITSNMNAGGAETFLMKIYRNIDRTRYQMDFCIHVFNTCIYEKEILSLGGRIYKIPPKSHSLKQFKEQLTQIIANNHYEYVLKITSSAIGFMDLKIAHNAGAKICAVRSSNSSDGGSFKAFLIHKLGRTLYHRYADVKIAPSDLAAKYTFGKRAYRNGEVNILHNAVDLKVYKYDEMMRNSIREELGIPDGVTVLGHIGRFMVQKNHIFLLDVFFEYMKLNKNSVLMLVGGGELEKQIQEKVNALQLRDHVLFTGIRSDVPALLSAMDVFVFPSLYEGMPNTVIEAQATGLPCIISDTITKEADVTGLVEYLPLQNAKKWAEKLYTTKKGERIDTIGVFQKYHYDIESTCRKFVELIFEDKT